MGTIGLTATQQHSLGTVRSGLDNEHRVRELAGVTEHAKLVELILDLAEPGI